jgi:hypothetical protein
MLSLLRKMTVRELLVAEGPSLAVSMAVAEFFYKFHSFTLECLAFLVTWCVVSALVRALGLAGRPAEGTSRA